VTVWLQAADHDRLIQRAQRLECSVSALARTLIVKEVRNA
jgi:hypothetical protein